MKMKQFLELFETYSNKDLLTITFRPENFQADAVMAARHILNQREVSEEDKNLASSELLMEASRQNLMQSLSTKLVVRSSKFIKDLMIPTDEFDVRKWVLIVSIFLSVQYLWQSIDSIRYLVFFFNCSDCYMTIVEPTYMLLFIYTPVAILLLLSRKKWGWRLILFNSVLAVTLEIGFAFLRFNNNQTDLVLPLFSVLLYVLLLRFLLRSEVLSHFLIARKTKENTIGFSILLSLGLFLAAVIALA
jgi:hypothetical protein